MTASVAVVSDGSGHTGRRAVRPLRTALADDAAVIEGVGGVRAVPIVVPMGEADQLAARLQELPDDVAAVFLTRTEARRARAAQRRLEEVGGRSVLTEEAVSAIALTAAGLTYLQRIGRGPGAARVLIAGADGMPILAPMLMGSGIHEVSLWNPTDEYWFPLHRAARDADVVIDLRRDTRLDVLAEDRPEGSVLAVAGSDGAASAVAPGMLRALAQYPPGVIELGVEQYCGCACAVAAATPPARRPGVCGPRLADAVAAAVHQSACWRP